MEPFNPSYSDSVIPLSFHTQIDALMRNLKLNFACLIWKLWLVDNEFVWNTNLFVTFTNLFVALTNLFATINFSPADLNKKFNNKSYNTNQSYNRLLLRSAVADNMQQQCCGYLFYMGKVESLFCPAHLRRVSRALLSTYLEACYFGGVWFAFCFHPNILKLLFRKSQLIVA